MLGGGRGGLGCRGLAGTRPGEGKGCGPAMGWAQTGWVETVAFEAPRLCLSPSSGAE